MLSKTKKNCISCVFCLHCRDTYITYINRWDCKKENLTDDEILQIKKKDLSFLSEAQKKQDEWIELYKKKEDERNRKMENSLQKTVLGRNLLGCLKFSSTFPFSDPYPLREEFGMDKCPFAPDDEYLICWKEIWGKSDREKWLNLENSKCRNFYPLSKKGTKTLKACEEELTDKKENKKYWRGVFVGFLSAIIVMLIRFYISPYFTSKNNKTADLSIFVSSPKIEKEISSKNESTRIKNISPTPRSN